jgi:hypothetical protein
MELVSAIMANSHYAIAKVQKVLEKKELSEEKCFFSEKVCVLP